jgi:hypothetical protein
MPRVGLRRAPVKIGLAAARVQQTQLLGAGRQFDGATGSEMREGRYATAGPRLRIDRSAGPNTRTATAAAIPMGRTQKKRGYPPITLKATPAPAPAKSAPEN